MNTSQSLYDVLFFIRGVPPELECQSDHWVLAKIAENGLSIVKILSKGNLRFKYFSEIKPDEALTAFVYRSSAPSLQKAIGQAFDQVEGLLDVYSLMTDAPPEASKIVLARQTHDADVGIYEYFRGGYAISKKDISTGDGQWHARNHLLLQQVLKHLDFVSGTPNTLPTEIREELLYALRMYRQGTESLFQGIEFLAKFSALECLVCGSIVSGKEATLLKRLGDLFEGEALFSKDLIRKLWLLRCAGSHQARVSTHSSNSALMPAGLAALEVDQLFGGVLYFILDNLDTYATLNEMWNAALDYTIPELICMHRPKGVARMPVTEFLLNFNSQIHGAGMLFDNLHGQIAEDI